MTHKPLTIAILISAGAHLAVFLGWLSSPQTLVVDNPGRPVASLTLVVSPATEQAQKKAPGTEPQKPVQTTRLNREPARVAPVQKETTNKSTPHEMAATVDSAQVKPVNTNDLHAELDHDMLAYLHSEFRVRFHYPMLARKRGWAGEVVIALNVNHDGLIDDVAIKKSSGYPLLDDNAVQTFRAIGTVTPAIQSRINTRHRLSIPVIYKLTGG